MARPQRPAQPATTRPRRDRSRSTSTSSSNSSSSSLASSSSSDPSSSSSSDPPSSSSSDPPSSSSSDISTTSSSDISSSSSSHASSSPPPSSASASPPPLSNPAAFAEPLRSQLTAFLPLINAANELLEPEGLEVAPFELDAESDYSGSGTEADDELEADGDGARDRAPYIEMNLGLGVLEQLHDPVADPIGFTNMVNPVRVEDGQDEEGESSKRKRGDDGQDFSVNALLRKKPRRVGDFLVYERQL